MSNVPAVIKIELSWHDVFDVDSMALTVKSSTFSVGWYRINGRNVQDMTMVSILLIVRRVEE